SEATCVAQCHRDVRTAAICEGTDGSQAMDFGGRKTAVRMGQSLMEFIAEMKDILPELEAAGEDFASIQKNLEKGIDGLEKVTGWMLQTGQADPNSVLAGATHFVRVWGLVVGGWLLAKSGHAGSGTEGLAMYQHD